MSTGDGFDVRSLSLVFHDGHPGDVHAHPWGQLTYARTGLMHVAVEGRLWFVPPTRAIWIPPGVMHELAIKGDVAFRTLYICPARAGDILRGVEAIEVNSLLRELIVHVAEIGMLDSSRHDHDRLAGVLMDLISGARGADLFLPMPGDARALRLAEQLHAAPADKRDLATLAAAAGASLRTLQRRFAEETGLTIEAWRQKARLMEAASALSQGASVTEAAIACGYDSQSAFIAAFRRQFNTSPGRFTRAEGRPR